MTRKMEIKAFSKKQLTVLSWWNRESVFRDRDAIICDGAVRSGKTFCMSLSFILWSFYDFCKFGLCTLRKDNPFFKAKYDYARDSDFEITRL